MRLYTLILGAAALARALDFEVEDPTRKTKIFNDIKVPPVFELTPENYDEAVKSTKFLMVKNFSPYCPHCNDFAPIYQTLYEFYYTSNPTSPDAGAKSFANYYDFHFAQLDCVTYYDMCREHKVKNYPMTVLYEDGEVVETMNGVKSIAFMSEVIERALERAHPGERPASITLPNPKDTVAPKLVMGAQKEKTNEDSITESSADTTSETEDDEKTPKSDRKKLASSDNSGPEVLKDGKAVDIPAWANTPPTTAKTQIPNKEGKVEPLTSESFETLVTQTDDFWFVKFYAPWCHHCQAMASNWKNLGQVMQNKVNIGEVNCDAEARLCKDVGIHGYPSIAFFRGKEKVDYQGLRGLGDFVSFINHAIDLGAGVPDVDADSFKELETKEGVIFVYFYDHAATSEDMAALERLTLSLIGRAKLVKTRDPAMYERFGITTWPRMLVSREGRATYYTPLTPHEMRDVPMILDWMRSVWLPLVPELTAASANEIMNGKVVVLGILNRDDNEGFLAAKRELKSAANEWTDRQILEFQLERKRLRDAKQMRIEEAEDRDDSRALRNAKNIRISMDKSSNKEVVFAWVDGMFWQRWIKTTYGVNVKDGERVIINDRDKRRYWDSTVTGNYILVSRTSIMETLDKITYSPHTLKAKLTISSFEKFFFDIKMFVLEHPYITLTFGLIAVYFLVQWIRSRSGHSRAAFLPIDDSAGNRNAKDNGFFGTSNNGKTD